MRGERKHLIGDQDGGIIIAAIFATAFLVGILYMLVGAGTAMQHGELMQDGADAAAFSAAQIHAKAMNMIALMNMVKLSAIAVLIAPPSIGYGTYKAAKWIKKRKHRRILYGWTLPFLYYLGALAAIAYAQALSRMPKIIDAADKAQKVLSSKQLPAITERLVNTHILPTFTPPIRYYSVTKNSVAVEQENIIEMCVRVYPYAYGIVKKAFKTIPSGKIRKKGRNYAKHVIPGFCLAHAKPGYTIKGGAKPGDEHFQVRAYAIGDDLSTLGERGVNVANWGKSQGADSLSVLRDQLSRMSFAQAEYYYDGPVLESQAMWTMKWRARLRRFSGSGKGCVGTACGLVFGRMKWAIVH